MKRTRYEVPQHIIDEDFTDMEERNPRALSLIFVYAIGNIAGALAMLAYLS